MLYIIPTPIGNVEDITLRGKRLLAEAKIIVCEDPRVTGRLLQLLDISCKPVFIQMIRHHAINISGFEKALDVSQKSTVAVVTDAGTPGMSDPGRELIAMAQDKDISYTVLPGASAIIPAVVSAGFVYKEFSFIGFLPTKKGRQTAWKNLAKAQYPTCLFESVHRMPKWIAEAAKYLHPDQKLCICREISKQFETIWVGTVADLADFDLIEKGEFAIVVQNNQIAVKPPSDNPIN